MIKGFTNSTLITDSSVMSTTLVQIVLKLASAQVEACNSNIFASGLVGVFDLVGDHRLYYMVMTTGHTVVPVYLPLSYYVCFYASIGISNSWFDDKIDVGFGHCILGCLVHCIITD